MHEIAVYLGPSLERDEAISILQADFLPPIRRGDIARLPGSTKVVGIIDGEFFQSLAVSPKEVVGLLDGGVTVFGASSMGALRAAETWKLGTVGVGEVFRMFRDGVLDGDDEVALAYDWETYAHFSEPLVNLRRALEMARDAGVIGDSQKDSLVDRMKACYFPDRSYGLLEQWCPGLREYFRSVRLPDIKRDDAREMLMTIKNMPG